MIHKKNILYCFVLLNVVVAHCMDTSNPKMSPQVPQRKKPTEKALRARLLYGQSRTVDSGGSITSTRMRSTEPDTDPQTIEKKKD